MKVPISWLRDFVDIDIPIHELAQRLTMAGLEVEDVLYVGLPLPGADTACEVSVAGIAWHPDKIVVAAITEVLPHPNADRLTLCKLFDGQEEHVVLTGAPNLFDFKGKGPLAKPLKVAYAKEGARIYDGHQPGQVITTLKRAKIRGVESYSMVCSEKELGISEEHEGILFLDDDAPVGAPLRDYIGDAILNIAILPNIARCANILGVAREVAALTGKPLKAVGGAPLAVSGQAVEELVKIEITTPELNPRFVLGLIRNVAIKPSSYKVQLRLKHAGMRPINNIVDATNYAMLEVGEPLHAFDWDVLVGRTGSSSHKVTIITRAAQPGEKLTTLDGVERTLDANTVLVCDTAGALSIAGVMGGAESEVSDQTRNILLEGASWKYTNIRRTARAQNLPSEASYRFARGVHPALAEAGVKRCLGLMAEWSGGVVAPGLVDNYPLRAEAPVIEISTQEVKRWLGIDLSIEEIARMLTLLGFQITSHKSRLTVTAPDHRLDIGSDSLIGMADIMEEIARIYGYDRIPETRIAGEMPPLHANPSLEGEERVRDILVSLGMQEIISHRLTSPERETRRLPAGSPADDKPFVRLSNPISSDRVTLRHSVLSLALEAFERNVRLRERIAIFEIGPIFLGSEAGVLPDEFQRLVMVLAGPRTLQGWQSADTAPMDFYDLKGMVEALLTGLHAACLQANGLHYEPGEHPTFHPGKCAKVWAKIGAGDHQIGIFGELHPLVRQNFDLPASYAHTPILAAEFDLDALIGLAPTRFETHSVAEFPPVLEDLALVVDEAIPAEKVAAVIQETGGKMVTGVRLFDVYRSAQLGAGKKSLAYSITYQATDKTLTDKDVAALRQKIVRRLEQGIGAQLRGLGA